MSAPRSKIGSACGKQLARLEVPGNERPARWFRTGQIPCPCCPIRPPKRFLTPLVWSIYSMFLAKFFDEKSGAGQKPARLNDLCAGFSACAGTFAFGRAA